MLDLVAIESRVDRGTAYAQDTIDLLNEVRRLYGQPTPPAALALEQAQAAQIAAQAAADRASASLLAAQQQAEAAAANAAAAKAVSDAAAKAIAEQAAKDKAAADATAAAAIVAQKKAVADSLRSQMDA